MLAATDIPTAAKIRETIAKILTSAAGGTEEHWWRCTGNVAAFSLAAKSQTNWTVQPRGTPEERDMVNRAVAVVREAYPYVVR